MPSTYRPEFIQALELLASAFKAVVDAGHQRPVLVGGAVVEFYTGGALVSGDFDVLTGAQRLLEEALIERGFVRPDGPGALTRGVHHSELGIGVEVVSGPLFEGQSDPTKLRIVEVATGEVSIPPVEDMIADRLGQFNARAGGDERMLGQAVQLYRIASRDLDCPIDEAYLERRIRQDTLNAYGLEFLRERAAND